MEQNLDALFAEKNEMILKGQIVEACEKFFADDAKTMDFTGALTNSRDELVAKEKGLLENMKNVNGITCITLQLQETYPSPNLLLIST